MDVTCRAKTTLWHPGFRRIYSCNIVKADLEGEKAIFKLTHAETDKTDDDVQALVILDCKLLRIPRNFQAFFRNLSILCVKQCNLRKIERKDLQTFENLKELWMPNNKLKELPENLFVDHPTIEKLSFSNNKISVIGAKLLDPLEGLKFANFNQNVTINVTFDIDSDKIGLGELKRMIRTQCHGHSGPVFKPGKRNFSFMRASIGSTQNICSSIQTISSIQNISCATSSSLSMVRLRHIFSSSSVNSQQSFQRVQYVARRRHQLPPKPKVVDQEIQTDRRTFSNDLNNFLFRENFKDFAIKNERKTFNVHKFVMAARSPAVRAMIENNPLLKGIELTNANDQVIEWLLNFIYEDKLPEFDEFYDMLKIFDLSMKLQLTELSEFSRNKILAKINTQNVIECLEVAAKHDDKVLKEVGLKIVQKMFPKRKFKAALVEDSEALIKMVEELKIMRQKIDEATLQFNQLSFFERS